MVNLFRTFVLKLICLMIFFASSCTPINNGSTMPPFASKVSVRINSFDINHNDIPLIIKNFSSKKARGCDHFSIK